MTLRAAFIVAFFASFFSVVHAAQPVDPFSDGSIDLQLARLDQVWSATCSASSQSIGVSNLGDLPTDSAIRESCGPSLASAVEAESNDNAYGDYYYTASYSEGSILLEKFHPDVGYALQRSSLPVYVLEQLESETYICPPDTFLTYTSSRIINGITWCYDPAVLEAFYDELGDTNEADENCANLVLDSGNNTGATMCYSSPTGNSCNVEMVQGAGYDYYQGVSANPLGCANSENPPFDSAGIGDGNDGCVNMGDGNYCSADKTKHCTGSGSNEVCDEGCLSFDDLFMCDASKHPDVGEGESDFFDDKGTCSVVAGSAYKGVCEELGGIWDKSGDYTDTSCPSTSIAGTCSVATNSGCFACIDAGGTWEPDPNAPLNNTEKGIQDVASLTQETNNQLKALELTSRKGNEALISTIKNTNAKLVGEIKTLTGKGSGGIGSVVAKLDELKEEKESYTTNASKPDKSKVNSLFDDNSTTALKAEIEVLKTELTTQFNTIRAEGASLFSIQVPSSSGYQARSLDLTYGSVDMSLNRFSQYFALLAGPIMFIASVIAGFILLGSRK